QLAHLRLELADADIGWPLVHPPRQRFYLGFERGEARVHRLHNDLTQLLEVRLRAADVAVLALDIADAGVQSVNEFDEPLRLHRIAHGLGEAGHLVGQPLEVSRLQRRVPLDGIDAIVDVADAGLDGVHAGRLGRTVGALDHLHLQVSETSHGGGDVVEALGQRRQIDLRPLRDQARQSGNLRFQPLDLAGFTDRAGQQLDHMGALRHLIGNVLDVARLAAGLRPEFPFEPLEAAGDAGYRLRQLAELRIRGAGRGRRRFGVPGPDLLDRRTQAVLRVGRKAGRRRVGIFAIAEAIDGALDRAQRLAVPIAGVGLLDLVAQLLHALRQVAARLRAAMADAGHLVLDLIQQGNQFAA